MATGSQAVFRDIQTLFHLGAIGALSDSQLLEQFLTRRGRMPRTHSRRWSGATARWFFASAAGS